MLRWAAELRGNGGLRSEVALDAGDSPVRRWILDGRVCNRREMYGEHTVRASLLARSGREGISGLSMVSHAVNWRCACHCMVLCREETRGGCRGPSRNARASDVAHQSQGAASRPQHRQHYGLWTALEKMLVVTVNMVRGIIAFEPI
jgi:hypothetical protein